MLDSRPEVQLLARAGMAAYLAYKPTEELASLSAAYERNCNVLAEREKKKRKSGASTTGLAERPDKMYMTTIMMASCMVRKCDFIFWSQYNICFFF